MAEGCQSQVTEILTLPRKEKRKLLKKQKRKLFRQQNALHEIEEEDARLNDHEEQARIRLKEQEEAALLEKQRREHEEREKAWLEAAARRKAEEEEQKKMMEESRKNELREEGEDDDGEYVEDGPAEIIWQGNEITVRKRKVKIAESKTNQLTGAEVDDRPTSNPLPPQSGALAAYNHITSDQLVEVFCQQTPNFGTEQDKAHCPFHFKTGACRFGSRCSRVHFYPDKSCTLLIKNMYSGPGLAWEQDEGLEHTDEEVDHGYEEFYEDVHTEFLKYGEIINFKVCRNGSSHLRGNVYVHYKFLDSAIFAYNSTNGRYFAGKQISCEYVGVTRWKIAICGEYMKSRSKTCSRGSTCNFLHCFRNPGGDYEWADWDNPPPKYWMRKMASLFGPSDEMHYNMHEEAEHHFTEKSTRDGEAHNRRSYSRWSSFLGRERGESSSNQVHSEKDRKRASHSSKKSHSHSRVGNKSHSRVGNPPEDCKQYDRRNHGNHHSSTKKRHEKSDSSEELFGEGRRRKGYSSTRSHNSHEEDELDDVHNSGDHHYTRKKEWRGSVSDEELREGGGRGRSCSSKRSQSRMPSSPEDSRYCAIPDFDVPDSNRKSNRKGRIPHYDTSRNHSYWNHEEEGRDSLDRRDGDYDSDSGQEPNCKEQKHRHRRSSKRSVKCSRSVALCEMHEENGCEICISGKECSPKKKGLYNHYNNNDKSEGEEPSSKYKEFLDGTAYTKRNRRNNTSEDEHKEHYLSSRSSRSRKKRYATDEKDEDEITRDEARSMDDKVLNNCDNNDLESQGGNVINMFDDRCLDPQSNSEHRSDRKRRRDGSKSTRSKDGSY